MRIYLDLCCLKRPFDSQDHPVVHLESEAVLALLGAPPGRLNLLRSAVHVLENSYNQMKPRREAVAQWLSGGPLVPVRVAELRSRSASLVALGFSKFDSLHLASAELSAASAFVTVDYGFMARLHRHQPVLQVRAIDPVGLVREVFGGTANHES